MSSSSGHGSTPYEPVWPVVPARFCLSPMAQACQKPLGWLELPESGSESGSPGSARNGFEVSTIKQAAGVSPFFPPDVAVHVVKLACEMPDKLGRSLSQWDCAELAKELEKRGMVQSISSETVRRILAHHRLKPWRVHMWLGHKTPRDEAFCAAVSALCDLYTRPLAAQEMVLSLDEKTSLQPRIRTQPTLAAQPEHPVRIEHEYQRQGALTLFAAFDTRTGQVYGQCHHRKRQGEFMAFLEYLNRTIPATMTCIHIICDNLRTHTGKKVKAWLATHPRFIFHFTPVHCSWMNQVEQWFSILQRKRLKITDFASLEDLRAKLYAFIAEWNHSKHPFQWTTKSVAKVMAYVEKHRRAA